MAHLYSQHRIASQPRRSSGSRRNFGDDEVEKTESIANQDLEFEISFQKRYGHYFDARDIKKKIHLLKTNPIEFENQILKDPEIQVRVEAAAQKEVKKQELILKGHEQLKKWSSQYVPDNFEMDEQNIQHFKSTDINAINEFNDEFNRFSRTVSDYIDDVEKRQVADHRNDVIYKRNERKLDSASFPKKRFEDTLAGYEKEEIKKKKQLKVVLDRQGNQPINDPVKNEIDKMNAELVKLDTMKTMINDIVIDRFAAVEFGSNSWFDKTTNIEYFKRIFDLEKYKKGTFNYTRGFKNHKVVFIPSAGGKSTLEENFGTYVFDVDKLLDYEKDSRKFKFLVGYSRYHNDWEVINNYWKELINMYEHKFRGKVLLCHGPSQLPVGMITNNSSQGLIILPSVKRWSLRSFKSNYENLVGNNDYLKVNLHYRYYFYIIYHFFKLSHNSWENIRIR